MQSSTGLTFRLAGAINEGLEHLRVGPINAPDEKVITLKAWVAGLLLGGTLFYLFATNLNLMLGLEQQHTATVAIEVQPGTHPRHRHIYRTADGGEFTRTVKARVPSIGIRDGEKVRILTDGFFWTEVVAVDSGDGFKRYR